MGSTSWICGCFDGAVLLSPWAHWAPLGAEVCTAGVSVCKWIFPPDSMPGKTPNPASLPLSPLSAVGLVFSPQMKTDLSADHPARESRHPPPLSASSTDPSKCWKHHSRATRHWIKCLRRIWRRRDGGKGIFFLKEKQHRSLASCNLSVRSMCSVITAFLDGERDWSNNCADTEHQKALMPFSPGSWPSSLLSRTVIQINILIPWIFHLSPSPGCLLW